MKRLLEFLIVAAGVAVGLWLETGIWMASK